MSFLLILSRLIDFLSHFIDLFIIFLGHYNPGPAHNIINFHVKNQPVLAKVYIISNSIKILYTRYKFFLLCKLLPVTVLFLVKKEPVLVILHTFISS